MNPGLSSKQKLLRNFESLHKSPGSSQMGISAAKQMVEGQLDNMLNLMGVHPNFKQLTGGDVRDANELLKEEREIEEDIAAAKEEIEGDMLMDEEDMMEEVQEIYEEVEDFEDEIDDLEDELNEYHDEYGEYNGDILGEDVDEYEEEYEAEYQEEYREELEEELESMEEVLADKLQEVDDEEFHDMEAKLGIDDSISYKALEDLRNVEDEYDHFAAELDDFEDEEYDEYDDEYDDEYGDEYGDGYVDEQVFDRLDRLDVLDELLDEELDGEFGEDEDEHVAIIELLDDEVDTQEELIERQSELIEMLKKDNAMKEDIIEELGDEEEYDYGYDDDDVDEVDGHYGVNAMQEYGDYGYEAQYDEEYEDEIEDERYALEEALEGRYEKVFVDDYEGDEAGFESYEQREGVLNYDDDDAGYEALMQYDAEHQQEAYYDAGLDAKEAAMVQDYDELYDVNGEGGSMEEDVFVGELEGMVCSGGIVVWRGVFQNSVSIGF